MIISKDTDVTIILGLAKRLHGWRIVAQGRVGVILTHNYGTDPIAVLRLGSSAMEFVPRAVRSNNNSR